MFIFWSINLFPKESSRYLRLQSINLIKLRNYNKKFTIHILSIRFLEFHIQTLKNISIHYFKVFNIQLTYKIIRQLNSSFLFIQ